MASLRNRSGERKYHATTFNPTRRKVEAWKRGQEFPKEFVTLPGETYPNSALVYACSTLLLAPKSAALQ